MVPLVPGVVVSSVQVQGVVVGLGGQTTAASTANDDARTKKTKNQDKRDVSIDVGAWMDGNDCRNITIFYSSCFDWNFKRIKFRSRMRRARTGLGAHQQ